MPYVDQDYYNTQYMGTPIPEEDFPRIAARASDIIDALTRQEVAARGLAAFPPLVQTLFRRAVCAQMEYLALNGIETATMGFTGEGYTVGHVSVTGGGANATGARSMACPAAVMLLGQAGLMGRRCEMWRCDPYPFAY